MKKVLLFLGTRPEAIKMCPLAIELKKRSDILTVVCVTGQHTSLLSPMLENFDVKSDYCFELSDSSLTDKIALMVEKAGEVINAERPDMILVHGDTASAYAAAIVAFHSKIQIGHVEAGLRTYDLLQPFPEEFYRQSIDKIATLCFAPTSAAENNLLKEGHSSDDIVVTGNTVIDAFPYTVRRDYRHEVLDWTEGHRMVILTMHRRENWGRPMRETFSAIRDVALKNPDVRFVYPVHPNPIVSTTATEILGKSDNIRLISPLDAIDFHNFLSRSYLIVTDSGGIQEEAPSFGLPVLILRNRTERPEGVMAGIAELIGTDYSRVYNSINTLLNDELLYSKMSPKENPYGDGKASNRIVDAIINYFRGNK